MKPSAPRPPRRRRLLAWAAALLAAYLILGTALPFVHHKPVGAQYAAQLASTEFYAAAPGSERVACVDGNSDALLWRLRLIGAAQREIILSTFEFHADESGRDVLSALLAAADRGVKVRVLIDGLSGFKNLTGNAFFKALAAHPNADVKVYAPLNPALPWQLQTRMHDKYLIADDSLFLLGGRNTFDLFLGDYVQDQNIDRELLVWNTAPAPGSSLAQLRAYFEGVWALGCTKPYTCEHAGKTVRQAAADLAQRYGGLEEKLGQSLALPDLVPLTLAANKVTLVANPAGPVNKEPWVWHTITRLAAGAGDVVIQTPYVICSSEMYGELAALCAGAGQVRIVTNAVESGANLFGCTDYLNQKANILATGAQVYEFSGAHSMHTKTVLVGDRLSLVGSYNMDMRSTYLDTELMLAVDCKELNAQLRAGAEGQMAQSRIPLAAGGFAYGPAFPYPEYPAGKRALHSLMRLVAPLIRHLM